VAGVLKKDKLNPLVQMSDSGARGSLDNFKQLDGYEGLRHEPEERSDRTSDRLLLP
jgi:DNA-directed RNA polymerase beta' subunit